MISNLGVSLLITTTYLAAQGDTLRLVCHKHYGESNTSILKMVIDKNPFVVSKLKLDAGDIVVLPPNPALQKPNLPLPIAIWDPLAFVQASIPPLAPPKEPTRVPKEKLLATLEAFRRSKIVPVPDETPSDPRPPLPYSSYGLDLYSLDDPFSLATDPLANLS